MGNVHLPSNEELNLLSATARDIYARKLRDLLEPEKNGSVVAIHLDSEDYELSRRSSDARAKLRRKHPEGMIVTIDVGPVDPFDPLTLRMLGNRTSSGEQDK